jgi:hypothetical protein
VPRQKDRRALSSENSMAYSKGFLKNSELIS